MSMFTILQILGISHTASTLWFDQTDPGFVTVTTLSGSHEYKFAIDMFSNVMSVKEHLEREVPAFPAVWTTLILGQDHICSNDESVQDGQVFTALLQDILGTEHFWEILAEARQEDQPTCNSDRHHEYQFISAGNRRDDLLAELTMKIEENNTGDAIPVTLIHDEHHPQKRQAVEGKMYLLENGMAAVVSENVVGEMSRQTFEQFEEMDFFDDLGIYTWNETACNDPNVIFFEFSEDEEICGIATPMGKLVDAKVDLDLNQIVSTELARGIMEEFGTQSTQQVIVMHAKGTTYT